MATSRNYIYIDGVAIMRPREFELEREDIYAAEYTSMSGDIIADKTGWRYAEQELKWDALPQSQFEVLTSISGQFTLGFYDESNTYVEEECIRTSSVSSPYREAHRGEYWWKEPSVKVRFIYAHNS